KQRGIEFLSTPFDPLSLAFLLSLDLPRIKIGSGDLTNAPLLHTLANAGAAASRRESQPTSLHHRLSLPTRGRKPRGHAGDAHRVRPARRLLRPHRRF